jgi:hypothetical protein
MSQHHTPSTDETVAAIDLTDSLPTRDTVARTHRRGRRLVVAAVALALVGGGLAAVALGGGSSPSTSRASATPVVTGVPGAVSTDADVADPGTDQVPQGDQGQPQADPEPQPPAEPGVLMLSTNAIHLLAGDYDGSFTVRNDGGSSLDWSFQPGHTAISVSQSGGTLAPGESTVVSFELNPFHLSEGGFVFINHVTSGDTSRSLTISGIRTPIVVNPNIPQGPQNIKP